MYELYEGDLQPRLASLGYVGTIQQRSEKRLVRDLQLLHSIFHTYIVLVLVMIIRKIFGAPF